jgi:hypothetical protein
MSENKDNVEILPDSASVPNKTVKAMPTSPVYAVFDIVEIDGKQVVTGSIGFVDQFGMERMAKTATDKGVLNLGKHILAIFHGNIDVVEPDEETKKKLAENLQQEVSKDKEKIINAYRGSSKEGS